MPTEAGGGGGYCASSEGRGQGQLESNKCPIFKRRLDETTFSSLNSEWIARRFLYGYFAGSFSDSISTYRKIFAEVGTAPSTLRKRPAEQQSET